ncbi:MAG: hypothetical protein D6681_20185 [Calditrichaeota bacterium]|nr:MAG: hypothetical protein D6681_20185 [Calditrichota bacterium]
MSADVSIRQFVLHAEIEHLRLRRTEDVDDLIERSSRHRVTPEQLSEWARNRGMVRFGEGHPIARLREICWLARPATLRVITRPRFLGLPRIVWGNFPPRKIARSMHEYEKLWRLFGRLMPGVRRHKEFPFCWDIWIPHVRKWLWKHYEAGDLDILHFVDDLRRLEGSWPRVYAYPYGDLAGTYCGPFGEGRENGREDGNSSEEGA